MGNTNGSRVISSEGNANGSRVIPSTGRVKNHGGIRTKSSLGTGSRFIFEGERGNPEQDTRKALITVKDLQNLKIEGSIIYIFTYALS